MIKGYTLEICTGCLEDVITASSFPETDRIELNCALSEGGLTPSLATLRMAREITQIPILCMVRPRGAGFHYTAKEKELMRKDAELFLSEGADGIVFGSLQENRIDEAFTEQMVQLIHSYGKTAVFHKAFDETEDFSEAMETLIGLGCDRILTSGGQPDCFAGRKIIRELIEKAAGRIEILPGGGITEQNIRQILQASGTRQFHMSAKALRKDISPYYAVDALTIQCILDTF